MKLAHYPERCLFTIEEDGHTAWLEYAPEEGAINILHTVVPPPVRGRNIASELVRAAVDYARKEGLEVRATCSYAAKWLERNRRS